MIALDRNKQLRPALLLQSVFRSKQMPLILWLVGVPLSVVLALMLFGVV